MASWRACAVAAALLCLVTLAGASYGDRSDKSQLLTRVRVLTLSKGKMTKGRRSTVPQLKVVGGGAQHATDSQPDVVQCTNTNYDDQYARADDINWECKADLDDDVKFGRTEVICEGYSSPDDEHITRGSCGLEYHLEYTGAGRQRQRNSHHQQSSSSYQHTSYHEAPRYAQGHYGAKTGGTNIFGAVCLLGVVFAVVYLLSNQNNGAPPPRRAGNAYRETAYDCDPPRQRNDNG